MTAPFQLFPSLDPATEAALRASIERFGVLVPVVRDLSLRFAHRAVCTARTEAAS